ncbi:hypothetical protein AVEN_269745-1 [Araneus ventricosus]|uniref:Uncharacterized protein n=1 Tax=Araneus ventricosus TaxID=182803 RepID=A0A4Y2EG45_ARAVE|nr:hypothetical protein AVEN_269745-1 [Araneus ventricosus]
MDGHWCGAEVWRWGSRSGVVLVICRGCKCRGPSQNSPSVASIRDVNITKPNSLLATLFVSPIKFPVYFYLCKRCPPPGYPIPLVRDDQVAEPGLCDRGFKTRFYQR